MTRPHIRNPLNPPNTVKLRRMIADNDPELATTALAMLPSILDELDDLRSVMMMIGMRPPDLQRTTNPKLKVLLLREEMVSGQRLLWVVDVYGHIFQSFGTNWEPIPKTHAKKVARKA